MSTKGLPERNARRSAALQELLDELGQAPAGLRPAAQTASTRRSSPAAPTAGARAGTSEPAPQAERRRRRFRAKRFPAAGAAAVAAAPVRQHRPLRLRPLEQQSARRVLLTMRRTAPTELRRRSTVATAGRPRPAGLAPAITRRHRSRPAVTPSRTIRSLAPTRPNDWPLPPAAPLPLSVPAPTPTAAPPVVTDRVIRPAAAPLPTEAAVFAARDVGPAEQPVRSAVPQTPTEVAAAPASSDESELTLRRRNKRRALVLAGGVAAAVVAIVAITVGDGPATPSASAPGLAAVVQSTGADGRTTQLTVTAPTTTVGGTLVAVVTGADGAVQQLRVVGAPRTGGAAGTTTQPPSTTRQTSARSAGSTGSTTSAAPSSPAARPATPTTAAPVSTRSVAAVPSPAGSGETATVVTGLTTLTGWELITTAPAHRTSGN